MKKDQPTYESAMETITELRAELEQVRRERDAAREGWFALKRDKEAAEQSRERMREALEKAEKGMLAVKSLVQFYTKHEMNAPANNQEAVRDARENEAAFDEGLAEARKALEGEG